jgi:Transcriptional regulators
MGATIRDVARAAGVGLGTVSRVLNNSPLVSAATRKRVLDVIAELQYTPSQIARSFASGKTLTVGTIAPFFTRPSVVERLRGIEATLADNSYDLVVFNVETVERRDSCLQEVPRRDRTDGVLIISLTLHSEEVATLQSTGVPVVLIDACADELPSVLIDDVRGGELATRHLIELGHRRIAFIGDADDELQAFNFTSTHNRLQGYLKALEAYGITPRPEYQRFGRHGRYRRPGGWPANCCNFPSRQPRSSLQVIHKRWACWRRRGICRYPVPAMLSVIGFDDIDVAEYLALTTVRQPLFESGVRGVELLLGAILGNAQPTREYLPIELVPRATTARPAP